MLSGVMDYLVSRSRARSNGSSHNGLNAGGRQDGLLWHQDIGRLVNGEYSAAVIQANKLLEDQSQVESGNLSTFDSGPFGTFVGIYDGHGGVETSRYINKCLFKHLKNFTSEQKAMSVDVLRKTFQATEDGFVSFVREKWIGKPQLASVGSCCLVGVVCNSKIYIANAGDSRAVLGRAVKLNGDVDAIQLSAEHNASIESVRKELRLMHPNDSQIVVQRHNVWRVKGIIQVSRSIGDLFLKKPEFLKEPLCSKFRLCEFNKPILSAEPAVSVHPIHPLDQFIIFASDGLWDQLSNQEAVNLVKSSPRKGIAKRLVKAALREAARKREMRYSDMMKIERGVRRHFHDDITVVVLFLESSSNSSSVTKLSNMPVPSSNSSSVTKLSNTPVPSSNSSLLTKLPNTPVPSSNSSSVTKLSNMPVKGTVSNVPSKPSAS